VRACVTAPTGWLAGPEVRVASRALVRGRGGRRRGDEMTDPVSEHRAPITLARGDGALIRHSLMAILAR